VGLVIVLAVVGALVLRAMTPEERARNTQSALDTVRQVKAAWIRRRGECAPFQETLRRRTPRAIVTPALVGANAALFLAMLFSGAFANPDALVAWGGNFAPRTTNGEWWRLVTSLVVHVGLFHVVINAFALVQIGTLLERLAGRAAVASIYFAAGIFAGLASVAVRPLGVNVGSSAAIFGLYGMLIATLIWARLQPPIDREDAADPSRIAIPTIAVTRLIGIGVTFALYNLVNDGLPITGEFTGLAVGLVFGVLLTKGVSEQVVPGRVIAATMGAAAVAASAWAFTQRGIADVRPEIARVVATEDRTAKLYKTAFDRFKANRLSADALAVVIEKTIIPDLQAADLRLKALHGVPAEHQPLVADAEEFVRLRAESWRLRAQGLRMTNGAPRVRSRRNAQPVETNPRLQAEADYRANLMTLGKAEGTERTSLEILERLKPVEQK
jgi:membrane associated rhomboid family serine protease